MLHVYDSNLFNRQDSQGGSFPNSIWELSSLISKWGNICTGCIVNLALKSTGIRTVHAFHIILQKQNPEGALNLRKACNYSKKCSL